MQRVAAFLAPFACWCVAAATVRIQQPAGELRAAAARLLDSFDSEQRSLALFTLDAPEFEDWGYTPRRRPGINLKRLGEAPRERVAELLRAALDDRAVHQVEAIRQLETVLFELESKPGAPADWRDSDDYAVSVFGDPRAQDRWAWRFEGHHVSLTFACDGDSLVGVTPQFLGSNPARRDAGATTGVRVLAAEEDLARELFDSLDDTQRAEARIDAELTGDITSKPGRSASLEARGLRAGRLNDAQRAKLHALIAAYTSRLRGPLADAELERFERSGDELRFAWIGSTAPGERCAYRVVGESAVIEFDNSQPGANHVHTLWRDVERDFGGEVLRKPQAR